MGKLGVRISRLRGLVRCMWITAAVFLLAACVGPAGLRFDHQAKSPASAPPLRGSAQVAVRDARSDVRHGDKPPCYLGTYYTGLGEAGDLFQGGQECVALARTLQRDLEEELRQLGMQIAPGGSRLEVVVREFEYDGFHTGLVTYQVAISVSDAGNETLAETVVRGLETLPNGRTRESLSSATANLPGVYDELVDDLLRHNDVVLSALR